MSQAAVANGPLKNAFFRSFECLKRPSRTAVDRRRAARLFEYGTRNTKTGVAGTLWAAYNGVTELIDHHDASHGGSDHLEFMWFRPGLDDQGKCS